MNSYSDLELFFPVLIGENKVEFQKYNVGDLISLLPYPYVDKQMLQKAKAFNPDKKVLQETKAILELLQNVEKGWDKIKLIADAWQLFINFHRMDSMLVLSRKRSRTSKRKNKYDPKGGRLFAGCYLNDPEDVEFFCDLLNNGLGRPEGCGIKQRQISANFEIGFSVKK